MMDEFGTEPETSEHGARVGVHAEARIGGEVLADPPSGVVDPALVALTAERDEYLDALQRLQAEFTNYRRRVATHQQEQGIIAVSELLIQLLPVLDAMNQAAAHVGTDNSPAATALLAAGGFLKSTLAARGLECIDPTGEHFDPAFHEAVGQVPTPEDGSGVFDEAPAVAQVLRPGYRWHDVTLRPAMVLVHG